jgi:uncharacterized protein
MWLPSTVRTIVVALGIPVALWCGWRLVQSSNNVPPVFDTDPVQSTSTSTATTRSDYEPLYTMTIGGVTMQASIADTKAERSLGLSYTTMLPSDVAKVFIFEGEQQLSFWMKDMHYPIDMFFVSAEGRIVHIVSTALPESYPDTTFSPPVPAQYVIETVAGFAKEHNIVTGDTIVLPVTP